MCKPRCGDCKYFEEKDEKEGTCHRNPPQPLIIFPTMCKDSWCGEFRPRNPQPVLETTTTITVPVDGTASGTQWISSHNTSEDTAKPKKKKRPAKKKMKK